MVALDWNGEDEGLMMIVEEWEVGAAIGDDHYATEKYTE